MSKDFHDPREELTHDIEAGNVYEDDRTGDEYSVVYIDDRIVLIRDEWNNTRMEKRDMFEAEAGAGRFKLLPDKIGESPLARVRKRAEELAESDGRKDKHKAEGIKEALSILSGDESPDGRTTVDFENLDHIGNATASNLRAAGYSTRGDVRDANDDELLDVRGVGDAGLESIRDAV